MTEEQNQKMKKGELMLIYFFLNNIMMFITGVSIQKISTGPDKIGLLIIFFATGILVWALSSYLLFKTIQESIREKQV